MPVIAIITLANIIDYLKAEANNEQLDAIKTYQHRYGV
jgi:orotate phosphoribosyltransferase